MDQAMEVDGKDDLIAQALKTSKKMKIQTKDAVAWEYDIACWSTLVSNSRKSQLNSLV